MNNRRIHRLAEAYQKELTDILHFRVRDPRLSGVFVTNVVFTPDLGLAKVYFDASDGRVREKEIIDGFESSKGYLKRELSSRVNIKYIPDLKFYYDEHAEMKQKIDQLFEKIKDTTQAQPTNQKDEESQEN